MSREIKFRAWSPYWNKMIYSDQCLKGPDMKGGIVSWIHTSEFRFNRDGSIELWLYEYMTPPANATVIIHQYHWVRDKEAIIQQFTGLVDKNGVEIYEGDILQSERGHKGTIEWQPVIASFYVNCKDGAWALNEGKISRGMQLEYTEVIGNIYQTDQHENKTQGS